MATKDPFRPIHWKGDLATGYVSMLDQRLLPTEETWLPLKTSSAVAAGIKDMVIRGAPAIGIAAAMGMALGARDAGADSASDLLRRLAPIREELANARPTAVNLFWALERMINLVEANQDSSVPEIVDKMHAEALLVHEEDIAMNLAMGKHGAELMPRGARILTHCNTGSLATGGYGTALGVIRACHERAEAEKSEPIHVWVDETRPYLQGARLTAWECVQDQIPATLITDSMAAWMMKNGKVDAVITGADRVVANGDAANKIGTYGLAVLAEKHGIPFYIAVPTSTIDMRTPTGDGIIIEERSADEVRKVKTVTIAPEEIAVAHPAFDVTPAELIAGIVTEAGVVRAPYTESIAALMDRS